MTTPFASAWTYTLLLVICIALGWRIATACLTSAIIAYVIALILHAGLSDLIPAISTFPSISVAIISTIGFWITLGGGLSGARLLSFILLVTTVAVNRRWTEAHTPLDVVGGFAVALISITAAGHLILRNRTKPVTSADIAPQWPDRIYAPPGHSYEWSRTEVAERYPDAATPLFADLFLPSVARAVQTMARSLGIKKEAFIIGYRISKSYIFSNMGPKVLSIPGVIRRFIRTRKEFLDYALNGYPSAKKAFWEEYRRLDNALERQPADLRDQYILLGRCLSLFEKWMLNQNISLFHVTFGLYYLRLTVFLHFPLRHKEILKALPLGLPTVSDDERSLLYKLGKLLDDNIVQWPDLRGEAKVIADRLLESIGDQAGSYDFTEKIWRQTPNIILEMARSTAASQESPEDQMARLSVERQKAENRLARRLHKLHLFSGRLLANDIIQLAHTLYSLKEERQKQMAAAWALVKRDVLCLGESLTNAGLLKHPEDIYFLTAAELSGLIHRQTGSGEFLTELLGADDVAAAVRMRQNQLRVFRTLDITESQRDTVLELPWKRAESKTEGHKGKYGLPGSITAPAVVIRSQEEFQKMQPGLILVAPMTNPHWDTLFGMAVGVVVERGGPTSHAMLKASEYALPAVIGLPKATKYIKDGDLIHVDGDRKLLTWETPDA